MTLIHKFNIDNTYMVIDINSGAVHEINEIIYDILDHYPNYLKKDILNSLKDKYSQKDIMVAIDEINYLMDNELLFTKGMEQKDFTNTLHQKQVIKAMCLHIAHDCNIRCNYCFASQGDFKGDRLLMSKEVGREAIDFLIEHSGNRRNLEVDFFGGEPLLNFDVVKDIVEYGRSKEKDYNKNFRFTITTNATLLTEEIMDYINENMQNVVLSIDGDKDTNDFMRPTINGKGTYDIIIPKIRQMVEKRGTKDHYVRGTFTKHNLDFSKDVLHLADQGFEQISVEPVVAEPKHDYALSKEDLPIIFEEYEKLAKEYIHRKKARKPFNFFHFMVDLTQGPCIHKRLSGCGAGNEYISITPEGDIYPCHQFVGDEEFKMGNIFENEIDQILKNQFKEAHVFNKDDCSKCWARFYCSGGCHANAYNFNEDINIPYEVGCEMEKKRIECALMVQAKMLEEDQR